MATNQITWKGLIFLCSLSILVFGSFVVSYEIPSILYFLILLGYMGYYIRLKNPK